MEQRDLTVSIHQEEQGRKSVGQPEEYGGQSGLILQIIAGGMQVVGHQERAQRI